MKEEREACMSTACMENERFACCAIAVALPHHAKFRGIPFRFRQEASRFSPRNEEREKEREHCLTRSSRYRECAR